MEEFSKIIGNFKNRKLSNFENNFALVLAAYGVIQILAQDLGIKTGKKQRDLVQKLPVQIAIFFSTAYMITSNVMLSLITISIYFGLKYYYSKGITSAVCFEEV